jgi:hypothetical protein
MPQLGFEPTIQVSECSKTLHASDRAITMIGVLKDLRPRLANAHFFLRPALATQ